MIRTVILGLLQALPALSLASCREVLMLIERHQLMGRGIGYLDTHLLASVLLDHARLWPMTPSDIASWLTAERRTAEPS